MTYWTHKNGRSLAVGTSLGSAMAVQSLLYVKINTSYAFNSPLPLINTNFHKDKKLYLMENVGDPVSSIGLYPKNSIVYKVGNDTADSSWKIFGFFVVCALISYFYNKLFFFLFVVFFV